MPLILNIETSTTVCSVALSKDGNLIAFQEVNDGYTHAENITVFIEKAIAEAKIKYEELDAIAVSIGPGSYTGLRIGLSTAKGLCYALNKPLIAISTLKSLAAQLHYSLFNIQYSLLCPMLDARRMEVFTGLYDNQLAEVVAPHALILNANSFSDYLENQTICFLGNGSIKSKTFIFGSKFPYNIL